MVEPKRSVSIPFSKGAVLVTMGVVYGDIGTSPMYVLKSIIAGNGGINQINDELILGSLSLIIWTLTLLTTIKYVLIAMKADNHGEGGIFALFSLVKKYAKWLILPAMIGGAALLADGVLTPAVTVTTAIEGLRSIPTIYEVLGDNQTRIVVITILIISALFMIQRMGTSLIGKTFGPIMFVWFLFLAIAGISNIGDNFNVLRALNPLRGIKILFNSSLNKQGIMILGSVFLATTGAEALYSDMGHVGKKNIYASWPFVKICLILNYLGQGAWLMQNKNDTALAKIEDINPFFQMLPNQVRMLAVILSAVAAVIASQALITGSFTLVSEATRLDLMPRMKVRYPSETKGQIYIPLVNGIMMLSCVGVVLYFRSSARLEAAYGLAITMTMLMTTILLSTYLRKAKMQGMLSFVFLLLFGGLEGCFFVSSLTKFFRGGYVALVIAIILFGIMLVWYYGTAIERSQANYFHIKKYLSMFRELRADESLPFTADNLVYITHNTHGDIIDRDVLYSIFNKKPKRAKAYWIVSVIVTDEPFTNTYTVDNFGTDYIFRVRLYLGFKIHQRINVYLRQIVTDLIKSKELPSQKSKYSIYGTGGKVGNFRFCMLRQMLSPESDIASYGRMAISIKYAIRHVAGTQMQWYGLESSSIIIEYVPLFVKMKVMEHLVRKE
ncbi:KUP/HAK/KT family potassium transporter [Anaerosporobacter sp.]|uniref:KUP/HAK/KT family potassium transporter n=1 Tax=Anaerosporobacter sp. TaxID=1872529 RepID=UPI00286F8224|nr:KUP/HAK/KT family potassium transporter [Anaerosporobacter sp.]